jgi:DNA-binding GntR family transcriptional regulator
MARSTSAPIRRPKSLTDIVAGKIRKAIIEGDFDLGQPISENMLSEMYDISKTPIKLALVQLRAEGLVEILPQKGSYVFTATVDDVLHLVEWRIATEEAALQAAYSRNKDVLIKMLSAAYLKMCHACEKKNLPEAYALDAEYHRNIVLCSNNKYLMISYASNIHKMNALLFRFGSIPWEYIDRFEEHNAIIEALKADKPHHAKSLLSVHIEHLCEKARIQDIETLMDQGGKNGRAKSTNARSNPECVNIP